MCWLLGEGPPADHVVYPDKNRHNIFGALQAMSGDEDAGQMTIREKVEGAAFFFFVRVGHVNIRKCPLSEFIMSDNTIEQFEEFGKVLHQPEYNYFVPFSLCFFHELRCFAP